MTINSEEEKKELKKQLDDLVSQHQSIDEMMRKKELEINDQKHLLNNLTEKNLQLVRNQEEERDRTNELMKKNSGMLREIEELKLNKSEVDGRLRKIHEEYKSYLEIAEKRNRENGKIIFDSYFQVYLHYKARFYK